MCSHPSASAAAAEDLGDFTTTARVLPISALALIIGICAAFVAAGLLRLIGLFTNLFSFQRVATDLVSPAGHHLGLFVIVVPVIGALVIGADSPERSTSWRAIGYSPVRVHCAEPYLAKRSTFAPTNCELRSVARVGAGVPELRIDGERVGCRARREAAGSGHRAEPIAPFQGGKVPRRRFVRGS